VESLYEALEELQGITGSGMRRILSKNEALEKGHTRKNLGTMKPECHHLRGMKQIHKQ
jgi:hypothetical protein